MAVWILGNQLISGSDVLSENPNDNVVLVESSGFAQKLPYHPHKLVLVFSAMRHFAQELENKGRDVYYYKCNTFSEGLTEYSNETGDDHFAVMRPIARGADKRIEELISKTNGTVDFYPNELFICSPNEFENWAEDKDSFRHEDFYRFMRKRTGYLMDGEAPVGGEWNFDEENREVPGESYEPPDTIVFEPDELTQKVQKKVHSEFDGGYQEAPYGGSWADPGDFIWPVTREEALKALEDFVTNRLELFGDYQDALLEDEWVLNHSLLSSALNVGLLQPREVLDKVQTEYEETGLPLNSVEGFIRQILGWREFMRHTYQRVEGMSQRNQLNAMNPLPDFYWTGATDMACLSDVIENVRERGYSHHIERLMILSNFATLFGVDPSEVNRWFQSGYVDAYHWVTTPNVVGMGTFGTDAVSTKPYVASANYVNQMSDYCDGCSYDPNATVGSDACPFNTLYWEFLHRNESELRSNHRMGLVYSHLDNKSAEEIDRIIQQADEFRKRAYDSDL